MNTIRNRAVVSLATVLVTLAAGAVLETAPDAQARELIHVTSKSDNRSAIPEFAVENFANNPP